MVGELLDDRVVGVLGPVLVADDHPTPRQRALIAALALAGSNGATIDELADEVWAGRPPTSARASLQNQMTRLRRRYGEDLIVCDRQHYRLGWTTDVALVDAAMASSGPTRKGERVSRLTETLQRWRDVPFADLDSHAAEVERARLGELRCQLIEELALARLESGRAAEAVTDLRAEIERDPYRDRTWELLAIALHHSGRRVEALQVLDDYAERLRSDFGADPAPPMVALAARLRGGVGTDPLAHPPTGQPRHRSPVGNGRRCRSRRRGHPHRSEP
jgi:DNA-binding SARP family transcriptional activator